ncbi:hypothetical protein F4803DRAFT_566412 [Xylaria telfairii]|nr:hypothetical protein F4803DRAFT_566412 [Xylaria telfairii]
MLSFLKNQIIKTFWGKPISHKRLFNGQQNQGLDMSAYADGRYMAAQKVDIFQIVRFLLQGHHRDAVASRLKQTKPTATESACGSSVDLAARLLLMLKVGVVRHQASPHHCLKWENGSLKDFVRDRFKESPVLDCHHVRLPKYFDAWSISTIGGLKIEFTDNLADHLLLVDTDTTVLIFHQASFLKCQVNTLYPDGLVGETLQTLALLFPQSEFSSSIRNSNHKRVWFEKLCSAYSLCFIERFAYWRDRLIILKQIYDDATPETIKQWWYDRRNSERWFTIWMAVLVLMITITLGLIQCIESALQVYKAYYPTVI